jgi:hypothetical protein
MRFVWAAACLFALMVLSVVASGQDKLAEAAKLKAEGDAMMGDIQYAAALAKYEQAYQLSADPALLYNQGRALEALSRYPEALEKLRSFDAKASPELHARVPNLQKLITDVENRTCLLTVEVAQKGATIRLGATVLGTSPLAPIRVNAGRDQVVEVSLEGHDAQRREVDLPGGGSFKTAFDLVSRDKSALLVIDSPVKGATIRVNDLPARQVPSEVRVQPGKHTIVLSADGYDDSTVEVVLKPTERKELMIEPGEIPVYERWWFWTIWGGVLVAGGASALTYALLTEGSPDEGSIPPCQVKVSAEGDTECEPTTNPASVSRSSSSRPGRPHGAFQGGFQIGPVPVVTVRF